MHLALPLGLVDVRKNYRENESESRKELKRREICIQTVMEMGYPRDLIDTAISELQHNGQNKFDAALLLETVFCIEERLKSGKQQQLIEEDIEGATGFVSTQNLDTNTTYINDVSQHIKSVKLDDYVLVLLSRNRHTHRDFVTGNVDDEVTRNAITAMIIY
ncbi:hypothetical protein KUTeg_007873 [Tegillarca granosa]|uniref:UBA domain-containing protein n=1 Tax=Tegillarca granosa TaxID=220873 RepID=A0ABQ9FEF4_TEGGR|nr:hypothetical protein KUTeg_007873 [Tegillarca granosa]